jgi:5-methoxybenzimidazole methyltransferase
VSSKLNLLFINTPISWIGRKLAVYPLGLASVATYAKKMGHNVDLIDLNLYDDHSRALTEALAEGHYDTIGIGLRSMLYFNQNQFPNLHEVVNQVAAQAPQSRIICGGNGFSLYAEQTMDANPNIAAGAIGEGEETFMELIEQDEAQVVPGAIVRIDGEPVMGPRRKVRMNPLEVPTAYREWKRADVRNYHFANMNGKRGCANHCFYCPAPSLHGGHWRRKSEDQIREEIEYLQKLDVRRIYVTDSIFNDDDEYNEIFYSQLEKKPIVWGAMFRPGPFDAHAVERLRATRCEYIAFSVDSGSERIIDLVKNDCSLDDVEKTFDLLKGYPSDNITYTFIVGYPEETIVDVFKTYRLMRRIRKLGYNVSLEALDVIPKTVVMKKYMPDMKQPFMIYDWKWRWFPLGIKIAVKFKTVDPTVW